ncbi:YopX family protein [Fusobacterium necrophorum]|uniref:YopX family protein n=1 Tax=Fusobacterium necrophorum TaxID=859 RepID=A0AAW6W812_9FUSO|nr:YopX family protein [Fusobacterium necrophorum]MDK4479951.1 YopX family protein [Fusobacterium necrophorum]MDK4510740.1 YopX family protein [Fusobacterium necrophorum]
MKEIKFRIFDNSEKKFLIKNEKVSRGIFKDKVSEIVDFENNSVQINNPEDERYIFLQYTGMKDINDKEIYEGDIVRTFGDSFIVFYSQEQVGYLLKDTDGYLETIRTYRVEVLGNIYENPELWKGE